VRGQFRGYRAEPGVNPDSKVETYAALGLHIDTWRWSGVPFYIRAGKNLPITTTQVMVDLKKPPVAIFDEVAAHQSNYFRFRLGPEVVIAAGARVKKPGEAMNGEAVELVARHEPTVDVAPPYQRLLGDALRGDASLFVSDESVEAAWRVVEPVLGDTAAPLEYEPGSWGPDEARKVFVGEEGWHDPAEETSAPC
jgi:glucose-6-phosphate 1-dehydrogenase